MSRSTSVESDPDDAATASGTVRSTPPRRGFVRQSILTAGAAGLALVTSLLLDVAIGATFGAGQATDAFFVASRIPIGICTVLAVGGNQALVPIISMAMARNGHQEDRRFVSGLVSGSVLVAGGIALVGSVVAVPLVRLTAPGLPGTDVATTAHMLQIMFAVVPVAAATEVVRAYLNARHASIAPAAMNVALSVVAAGIVLGLASENIEIVAWAYLAGASARLVFIGVFAFRQGFRYRPVWGVNDPAVHEAARLCVRPLVGASLIPSARIGEQALVSFLPPGSITVLNYGYRLVSGMGGSVFFRSVIVVLVPRLTEATAAGDRDKVLSITAVGVRVMLAISLVMTVGLMVLAEPLVQVLFRRGNFDQSDAASLALVMTFLSLNFVGDSLQRVFLAPFFARLDMKVPFRNSVYGVITNLVLLPVFVLPFREGRSALLGAVAAFVLAQFVCVGHAYWRLRRDVGPLDVHLGAFTRVLAPVVASIFVTLMVGSVLLGLRHPLPRSELAVRTAIVGLVSTAALYLTFRLCLRGREVRSLGLFALAIDAVPAEATCPAGSSAGARLSRRSERRRPEPLGRRARVLVPGTDPGIRVERPRRQVPATAFGGILIVASSQVVIPPSGDPAIAASVGVHSVVAAS